jgi:hypothetical protein
VLQAFHEKHPGVHSVSIACDVTGPEYPMRYLRRAKATFEMLLDACGVLSRRWSLKKAGVSILLDEEGCVMATGGHLEPEFMSEVERLLPQPPRKGVPEPKVDTKNTQAEVHLQYAGNLLTRKRTADAVAELRKALAIDPGNPVIFKQIWVLEHPEKFYDGAIDKEWQKTQLIK